MHILLTTLNAKYIHTNLAIRLLYQLNRDWPGLAWKEFTIKEDRDAVAKECAQYEVVAFSCYIWNITQTLDVARRIKAIRPDVRILLGGPEVSYDWETVIAKPEIDYIITGEGEIPFRAFLENYPQVQHVPNVVQKLADGQILYLPITQTADVARLGDIMPYRDDDPAQLSHRVLYIETSRGCPYKCEFCLASLDNKVRYLPTEHIQATLLYLMEHGRVIKFLDRTFNLKRVFTLSIFEFILANYRPQNVFQFEITADILHPDIVQFIQEKVPEGLFRFEIGIQTVNQTANLAVSRKQDFAKTMAMIENLRHKVEMHLDLIVGLPHDRWADIRHSFDAVFALYPPELQLGFLKFLKGTPMLYKHAEHGYIFDPEPPYQIIESNYLTRTELQRIAHLEHALEVYWNKKRAPHTLRYAAEHYGAFDFLLGVGTYFAKRYPDRQPTLPELFDTLHAYVNATYPDDLVLHELVAIEYYLYAKVCPKTLFLAEIENPERATVLQQLGERNTGERRYKVLRVHFDFGAWANAQRLERGERLLVIVYTGVNWPVYQDPSASLLAEKTYSN